MDADYPEVTRAVEEIRTVIAALEKNGGDYTALLRAALSDIETGNRFAAKEAVLKVGEMCHPKCLGDIYLKDVSSAEWFSRLERLEAACASAFERLENL